MVTVYKEAGRPLPRFHDDDVIDFQVTEAVIARAATERLKAKEQEEREEFRGSHKDYQPGQAERGTPRRRLVAR